MNAKIKKWKFFAQTLENTSLPFVGNCLDIVCSLINKHSSPSVANIEGRQEIAAQMRQMWKEDNALEKHLQQLNKKNTIALD